MIPDPLRDTGLQSLELLINRALRLDPASQDKLFGLHGKRFKLECSQPAITVFVSIHGDEIGLSANDDEAAVDTALRGELKEFIAIATAEDAAAALINGNVQVRGDTGPLLALRQILAELDIDWEAPLARIVGDVAAHQLGKTLRHGQLFARKAFGRLREQLGEFVVKDSGAAADKNAAESFYRDIEKLATDTDRLAARLQQLRQELKKA